ncbi:MAG: enoyl-CoA hydratase-related protein [Acidobacteriota bacterium]
MTYTNILYEKREGIGWITINRPDKLNALNKKTLEELNEAICDAGNDGSISVVILTGSGQKAFVAGADIAEISLLTPQEGKDFALNGQSVFSRIENLGKPVIAAINGFALGGGCELAMACTIRIASENAKFGQPEVNLGIIPGYGGTQRLARLLGKGRGLELILMGDMIDANEACRIGLINKITKPDELFPACEAMAKKIMSKGPLAIRYALEAVNMGLEMPIEEGLFLEATLFGLLCGTEDMHEGMKAFMEKRMARFAGK